LIKKAIEVGHFTASLQSQMEFFQQYTHEPLTCYRLCTL